MSTVVVGIDVGTTGVKVVALDLGKRQIVAAAAGEYPTHTGDDGRHEQTPEHWWDAVCTATRAVLRAVDDVTIAAVGLSGQMHSLLLVDDHGEPVTPAMTWADRRVNDQVTDLAALPAFRDRAGNDPVAAFTAPKLAWFVRRYPELLAGARHLLLAKDYLGYRLTGQFATDTTDAMGTLLWDVHRQQWDRELFDWCGAPFGLAPPVLSSTQSRGTITAEAAAQTGLPTGTIVAAGAGDVSAAVVGSGASRNTACLNAGTAAQVMAATENVDPGAGFLFGDARDDHFLAMASVYAAGASIRWAHEHLGGGHELGEDPSHIPAGSEGLVYLPFMFGATLPRKNDDVRAAFLGQRQGHSPAHLMAAVVEGVAFACVDAVEAVCARAGGVDRLHLVGGVARSSRWRAVLAAVLDLEVSHATEGGSPLGAAILGAVAADAGTFNELASAAELTPVLVPDTAQTRAFRDARGTFQRGCDALV